MLTILTVNYNSAPYLEENFKLISRLNPDLEWQYLIVDNSPNPERFSFPCTVLEGVPQDRNVLPGYVNWASYHHATALDSALPHIKGDYLLVSDADFFTYRPFQAIIQEMQRDQIDVFGAGYPKDGKNRIQGVPVAFNMLVDLKKVDISKWSFRPGGVLDDGTIADTGYYVYRELKEKYRCRCPQYVMVGKPNDVMMYEGSLYGIHMHAKLHLRNDEQLRQRIDEQLKEMKRYNV